MKILFTLFSFLFCLHAFAQPIVTVTDADLVAGQTYSWTNDNIYLLDGFVFLEEGGTLHIEAGTVIKGKESPTTGDIASTLIITRGAQIFAEGSACQPIIFTAEIDDLDDPSDLEGSDRGLWGGLIMLGRARNTDNTPETAIEGLPAGDIRSLYGAPNGNFNDDDNSGVLRFVSIRHGGAEIGAGNEINGLTLGGIGRGTLLEYIEVFANVDDGIEFFGGTVNLKYAAVSFCGDDSFDWDNGYQGKGQFWFVLQGSDLADNGAEMDGAIPDGNTPFAKGTVYNATFIGAGFDAASLNEHALLFRDGTGGIYANSIFTDYRNFALQVEDRAAGVGVDSRQRMEAGDLQLLNNVWWNFGSGSELNAGGNGIIQATPDAEDPSAQFLIDHLIANGNALSDPGLGGISRTQDGGLDPRPSTAAAFNNLAQYPNDPFYTAVDYKGAFGGSLWLRGWTAIDEYGYLASTGEVTLSDGDLAAGGTYQWTNDNVYILDGFVFVEEGAELHIEAGTVIKGKESPTTGDIASTLIITRGAKIFAEGNADAPIIFTAEIDDLCDANDLGESDRGLWGGLILLGRARNTDNTPETAIEGLPAGDPRGLYGAPNGQFIDDDNSGVLRYVSIRHGGAEIGAGNEINGLTLGGVGSGTELEYIEVFANVDDGIEFFGGTVNLKYAVVAFCGDDSYDWDTGYQGKGQFWFALQGSDLGDNGAEMDGAIPDGNVPFAKGTIYNATFIGSGLDAASLNEHALLFRDGSGGIYANSIFTDYRSFALQVEDRAAGVGVDSRQRMEAGDLQLLNNLWWNFGSGSDLSAGGNGIIRATPDAEDPSAQFLIDHLVENDNELTDPALGGISRTTDGGLDPRPNSAAAFNNLASYPNDPFYTPVGFKGAFCSEGVWFKNWTAVSAYGYLNTDVPGAPGDCDFISSTQNPAEHDGFRLDQSTPNPVLMGENTRITFELPVRSTVTLRVVDVFGREVNRAFTQQTFTSGTHSIEIRTENLSAGMYFYSLYIQDVVLTRSFVVQQ